jgi:hypothetical protein
MGETGDAVALDCRRARRRRLSGTRPSRNYGPKRSIGWKTTPDSRVEHAGIVRFDGHRDETTRIDIRNDDAGGTVSGYLERERKEATQGKNPTWITGELREELAPCVSQILPRHSARADLRNSRSQRPDFFLS